MTRQQNCKLTDRSGVPDRAKYGWSRLISDSCIQTIACMLLTLGLCVIGIVLYMAVHQSDNDIDEGANLYVGYNEARIDERTGWKINVEYKDIETVTNGFVLQKDNTKGKPFDIKEVNTEPVRQCPHPCCGVDCLGVDIPAYELNLMLFINHTLHASIDQFTETSTDTINIIWFSEDSDEEYQSDSKTRELPEHKCMAYKPPYLIIDNLKSNTTYTFCMLDNKKETISPLNCQALHVPAIRQNMADYFQNGDDDDDDEESDSTVKQDADGSIEVQEFTIGILCLIFSISALVGAVIAYLSISSYPDLLEGSKNVFIVRKSNKTGYITTISDAEYTHSKSTSMKKRRFSESLKRKRDQTQLAAVHTNAYTPEFKSLPNRSEVFSNLAYEDDGYEIPKHVYKKYSSNHQNMPNNYYMSPNTPPALPKQRYSSSDPRSADAFGQVNEAL